MEVLLAEVLNGMSYAAILFLIASGFSLVYGVMGILNLAHGALYMLGAYIGLTVAAQGGGFLLGVLTGAAGATLIGLLLERVFLSRLYKQINAQVLLTLGFVYIFENAVLWIWGPYAKMGSPPAILSGFISIGEMGVPIYRFMLIFIGLAVAACLWWFQEKTRPFR